MSDGEDLPDRFIRDLTDQELLRLIAQIAAYSLAAFDELPVALQRRITDAAAEAARRSAGEEG